MAHCSRLNLKRRGVRRVIHESVNCHSFVLHSVDRDAVSTRGTSEVLNN
jgi:hypothetical protein